MKQKGAERRTETETVRLARLMAMDRRAREAYLKAVREQRSWVVRERAR